jgi:hypothetical protein
MDQQSKIRDFGEVVNDNELPSIEEAKLNLRIPHSLFDKLLAQAQKRRFPSVEAFAEFVLTQAVTQKVGATHIDGPEMMSGETAGKITGFKGGIVTRA